MNRQVKQVLGLSVFAAGCMALGMGLSHGWVAKAQEEKPVTVEAGGRANRPAKPEVAVERHTAGGQAFKGIVAAGFDRIEDGKGIGDLLSRLVVIADDHIDTELIGAVYRARGRYTHVHRYHNSGTGFACALHG